ncbi:hypothetical protein OH77DRAFT_1015804 [Trametes cingulata]|nr:hypothetical protein OH77DRAFT_1015804 [Trametes cingulata]
MQHSFFQSRLSGAARASRRRGPSYGDPHERLTALSIHDWAEIQSNCHDAGQDRQVRDRKRPGAYHQRRRRSEQGLSYYVYRKTRPLASPVIWHLEATLTTERLGEPAGRHYLDMTPESNTIFSQRRSVHHVNHGRREPRGGLPKPASAEANACRLPCRVPTPRASASPKHARLVDPRRRCIFKRCSRMKLTGEDLPRASAILETQRGPRQR